MIERATDEALRELIRDTQANIKAARKLSRPWNSWGATCLEAGRIVRYAKAELLRRQSARALEVR